MVSHLNWVNNDGSVEHLLNPCLCQTTGICICCQLKTERRSKRSVGTRTPLDSGRLPIMIPNPLAEVFEHASIAKAFSSSFRHSITTLQPPKSSINSHALRSAQTRLYSPYHIPPHIYKPPIAQTATSLVRPSSPMRAVSHQDGAIASDILRAALSRSEMSIFDTNAAKGGYKVEAMRFDANDSVTSLASDDVVFGACTRRSDCVWPECLIHGSAVRGYQIHEHASCGSACTSTSDSPQYLPIPSIASVEFPSASAITTFSPPPPNPMTSPTLSTSSLAGRAASNAIAPSTQLDHPSHWHRTSEADSSSFSDGVLPPQADSASGSRVSSHYGRRANVNLPSPQFSQPPQHSHLEPRSAIVHGHSANPAPSPLDFQAPTSISIPTQSALADAWPQPPQSQLDAAIEEDASGYNADLLAYINQLTCSFTRTPEEPSLPASCSPDFADPITPLQRPVQPSLGENGTQDLSTGIGLPVGMNGMLPMGDFSFKLNQMSGGYLNSEYQQTQSPFPTWKSLQTISELPHNPQQLHQQRQARPTEEALCDFAQVPPQTGYGNSQQQQQDPQQMVINESNPNPNVIDLSKPLEGIQVEKILRVLQQQGTSNQQDHLTTHQFQPQSPFQMPHLHSGSNYPDVDKATHPLEEPQYSEMLQQGGLIDEFMLFTSPPAPDSTGQQSDFGVNQMYE